MPHMHAALLHGDTSAAGVDEAAAAAQELASDFGGSDFRWSGTPEGRAALWEARHGAYWASIAMVPGARGYPTDVCVPISHLADSVRHAQAAVQRHGIVAPMVGHVGDGNYHMMLLVNPDNAGAPCRLPSPYSPHPSPRLRHNTDLVSGTPPLTQARTRTHACTVHHRVYLTMLHACAWHADRACVCHRTISPQRTTRYLLARMHGVS